MDKNEKIQTGTVKETEKLVGITFSEKEREELVPALTKKRLNYYKLRETLIANDIQPPIYFNPIVKKEIPEIRERLVYFSETEELALPEREEDVAFLSILQLSHLIQNKKLSSMELTELYLKRLRKYDTKLECVITYTDNLAFKQARKADIELSEGKYRGLLQGIPFGIKDLFSHPDYPTTWGAEPYKNQILKQTATVINKLEDAGAVMLAKLSTGRLASDHKWFDGETKSPWNLDYHAGGSSAGSASATAAGLVGFSIGTETWGSIIQPCHQCGTTGLRPTYGRVSTHGVMSLSWSLDKIGPICRTIEDCAIVFNAIYGPDKNDKSVVDIPFYWNVNQNINNLKIGYTKALFDEETESKDFDFKTLDIIKKLGFELIPIDLPTFSSHIIDTITTCDAATTFEELTLKGIELEPWTDSFKAARFIPAIEYIKVQRIRMLLMQEMVKIFEEINIFLTPTIDYTNNFWETKSHQLTNLTGHPATIIPNGFKDNGMPSSITFIGDLYREEELLLFTKKVQDLTNFHLKQPEIIEKGKVEI